MSLNGIIRGTMPGMRVFEDCRLQTKPLPSNWSDRADGSEHKYANIWYCCFGATSSCLWGGGKPNGV